MSDPIDPVDDALTVNAADAQQVQRARQTEKARAALELDDLRAVLSTAAGRRFIWSELGQRGLYEDMAGPIEVVARFLGRRSEGLRLQQQVMQFEELYLLMQQEAYAAARLARDANAAARKGRTTKVI